MQRCNMFSDNISSLASSPMNLMFPNIFLLANCRLSSSSAGDRDPSLGCMYGSLLAAMICDLFSNSALHLLSNNRRNVHGLFSGSKFGASFDSRLHSCAYIDEYLGSSRAFSNIKKITPFRITLELSSVLSRSSLNLLKFSGVSLLRRPRTFLKMRSFLFSGLGTSLWRNCDGGIQRRLAGGTASLPETRATGPVCLGHSVLMVVQAKPQSPLTRSKYII